MANLRIQRQSELLAQFNRILDAFIARVYSHEPIVLGIAYSGGLDSTVLLHLAHTYSLDKKIKLVAFHIHHGLNPHADDWLSHCQSVCKEFEMALLYKRIHLQKAPKEGIEAAARYARYRAIDELSQKESHLKLILTAHHENDQAETVLMQMMRGAGVKGLSGMEPLGQFPEVDSQLLLGRPLLSFSRQSLEAYAKENALKWVHDGSNNDNRYTRNAIRNHLLPEMTQMFPQVEKTLARSAMHMQMANRLLEEVAQKDLLFCEENGALSLSKIASLGEDHFDNLFRYWLSQRHLRMPSVAWLENAKKQLFHAKEDAQMRIEYEGMIFYRYRDHILMQPSQKFSLSVQVLNWNGQEEISLENFGGKLIFTESQEGLERSFLLENELLIQPYSGRAKMKVQENRKTRTLKQHYQEKGISAIERGSYPLIYVKNELLFAPEIGLACQYLKKGSHCIAISWKR